MRPIKAEERRRVTAGRQSNMPRFLGSKPVMAETTITIDGKSTTYKTWVPDPSDAYATAIAKKDAARNSETR